MDEHILLTVDLTDASSWRKALPTAAEYCQAFGSTLHLLTVVPDFGMTVVSQFFPENYQEQAIEEAKKELRELSARHVPAGVAVQHIVTDGTVYEEILGAAENIGADLVVMAAHRPELRDYVIGPNAARVVRHFRGSVMVIRE